MKSLLLAVFCAAAACASPIYAPGQTELAIYNFTGTVSTAIAPDFSWFPDSWRRLQQDFPDNPLPLYGLYPCSPYCLDFTGVTFAPYGPLAGTPGPAAHTPEVDTAMTAVSGLACLGLAFARRRKV